jgi:hypothetical protein
MFWKFPVALTAVRVVAVAPLVFLLWFLVVSPASALVLPGDEAAIGPALDSDTSIVWIIFDQLPLSLMLNQDGSISEERFPNFAHLAAESTWYSGATTVSSETRVAVPSSLSGRHVSIDALPVASATPVNLFTVLGSSHRVTAMETFTQPVPTPSARCRPKP